MWLSKDRASFPNLWWCSWVYYVSIWNISSVTAAKLRRPLSMWIWFKWFNLYWRRIKIFSGKEISWRNLSNPYTTKLKKGVVVMIVVHIFVCSLLDHCQNYCPSRSMIEYTKGESKQVEIITATVARAELAHLWHVNGIIGEIGKLVGFIRR